MAGKLDPREITEKWAKRLKAAGEEIRRGVDKVDEAPSKKAVEAIELFKKRLLEAIESGRWSKQLEKVSLEDWRRAMKEFGVRNIAVGVEKAKDKRAEFDKWLVEAVESARSEIKTEYTGDIEDSIARMGEFIRAMAKRKYKG